MTIGSLCFGHWKKFYIILYHLGVSENSENPIVPNGFADHDPVFKWLFHWEYSLFSEKLILYHIGGRD